MKGSDSGERRHRRCVAGAMVLERAAAAVDVGIRVRACVFDFVRGLSDGEGSIDFLSPISAASLLDAVVYRGWAVGSICAAGVADSASADGFCGRLR